MSSARFSPRPTSGHRAAFVTAYGAGLRVSGTVAVRVGDIKPDRKRLHIPSGKGGAERMTPLPDGVIDYRMPEPDEA